jgi:hypothetical protein
MTTTLPATALTGKRVVFLVWALSVGCGLCFCRDRPFLLSVESGAFFASGFSFALCRADAWILLPRDPGRRFVCPVLLGRLAVPPSPRGPPRGRRPCPSSSFSVLCPSTLLLPLSSAPLCRSSYVVQSSVLLRRRTTPLSLGLDVFVSYAHGRSTCMRSRAHRVVPLLPSSYTPGRSLTAASPHQRRDDASHETSYGGDDWMTLPYH